MNHQSFKMASSATAQYTGGVIQGLGWVKDIYGEVEGRATCSQAGKGLAAAPVEEEPLPDRCRVCMCVCAHSHVASLSGFWSIFTQVSSWLWYWKLSCVSHEAGKRRGRGQGKPEISLRRDQWSCVEKKLIELRRGAEKRIKVCVCVGGGWLRH